MVLVKCDKLYFQHHFNEFEVTYLNDILNICMHVEVLKEILSVSFEFLKFSQFIKNRIKYTNINTSEICNMIMFVKMMITQMQEKQHREKNSDSWNVQKRFLEELC